MDRQKDPYSEGAWPEGLADGLRRLYPSGPAVPEGLDDEILARARSHFVKRRRLGLVLRLGGAVGAAAAVLTLAVWLGQARQAASPERMATSETQVPPVASSKPMSPLASSSDGTAAGRARADFDGSGRVDILDAFALARRLESGRGNAADPAFDLNGDGRVDRRDVDLAALAAVRLERGELQ